MRKVVRFALFTMVASLFFAMAAGAHAAEITVSNQLDIRLSVTLAYYDQNSGTLVTRGWWHVDPHGTTVITVDADESRDIFYAAYNKDQFVDSTTRQNAQIQRWAGPRNFTYTGDEAPTDEGVWQGRFYKVNGSSVNVDARPRGSY